MISTIMKFGCILVINFLCTLYIAEGSTAERDDDNENYLAHEISNGIMDNGSQRNTGERYNIKFPAINEASESITEQGVEIDILDMQRGKKGNKKTLPRNCFDLKKMKQPSGTYMIYPCDDTPSKAVEVYCNMDNGGGWTVIQRRDNYATQQDFYLSWNQYMLGFGDVKKDFWLGNDNIHCLTKQSSNEIIIDLEKFDGNTSYACYDFFYVAEADEYYKMEVGDYTGTAGDSFTLHSGMKFSTRDADNDDGDRHCAELRKGGWWYKNCMNVNLNGMYNGTQYAVVWYGFNGWGPPLKATEMKIRPKYD